MWVERRNILDQQIDDFGKGPLPARLSDLRHLKEERDKVVKKINRMLGLKPPDGPLGLNTYLERL